jgi:hypothetical protein
VKTKGKNKEGIGKRRWKGERKGNNRLGRGEGKVRGKESIERGKGKRRWKGERER